MKTKTIKRNVSKVVSVLAVAAIMAPTFATLPVSAQIRDNLDPNKTFVSEFSSWEELLKADEELNVKIGEEGFALLKNANNALPLAKGAGVTVLGQNAIKGKLALGGGGSGSQEQPTGAGASKDVYDALEAAGFKVNPGAKAAYTGSRNVRSAAGASESTDYMNLGTAEDANAVEFAGQYYTPKADNIFAGVDMTGYKDAAIVVLMRLGTEGADANINNAEGHTDPTDTYFSLEDNEKEMIAYAKANFDKVVIVLNAPSAMELHDVEKDPDIDGVIWMGQPGWNAVMALGSILNGDVNPSGHLVDIFMADQTKDPTYYNFGNYRGANYVVNEKFGDSSNTVAMGHTATSETTYNGYAIDYAEGIYMGYRYYETVAADLGDAGEAWYQKNVTYPFGHGLSYTTFEQTIKEVKGDLSKADGKVTVSVEVKNTGSVAGKDVVQLYATKPYTPGGIEKAAVDLVKFDKTSLLQPDKSEIVELTINVKDLASFDYDDKNENENCGYELEAGDYVLSVRADSHRVLDSETLTASALLTWDEDGNPETPNNIFSQPIDSKWGEYNTLAHAWTESHEDFYLSRTELVEDGEAADLGKRLAWLLVDDGANNVFVDAAFDAWGHYTNGYAYYDYDDAKTATVEKDYENLWVKTAADVEGWTQGAGVADEAGDYAITLNDMKGVPLDDARWTEFMNQLTWDELKAVISSGGYQNIATDSVNKPHVSDEDGPGQLKGRKGSGWAWACEVILAATWNMDLAYRQGELVGEESMYLHTNGWYGPAMNTHRNPCAGRNFEYFSQDGVQGGWIAAANVKGAVSKGCHVYSKHSFLNDQETSRMNTCTFATEQAIREIYAKQFELTVREGENNGFMNAFNRIGVATSCNYAVAIQLYENEWGFDGFSVTDYYSAGNSGWSGWAMARGTTIPLGNTSQRLDGDWDAEKNVVVCQYKDGESYDAYTQWYWVRTTAQRVYYTTVNNNAMMNGLADVALIAGAELTQYEDVGYQYLLSAKSRVELSKFFGKDGYEIESVTGLPAGVTLLEDGVITGKPTASGDFTVTVRVCGLGSHAYLNASIGVKLSVAAGDPNKAPVPAPSVLASQDKAWKETALDATIYAGALGQNVVVEADAAATAENVGKITAYKVEATGLPEGLTLDAATGKVTGKATADAGKYEVSVKITYTQIIIRSSWNGVSYRAQNYTVNGTITLTVEDGAMPMIAIMNGYWYINGVNTGIPVTGNDGANGLHGKPGADGVNGADGKDGVGIAKIEIVDGVLTIVLTDGTTVSANVVGPQGPQGEQGAQGPAGADGANGADAQGCGSTIASAAAITMLVGAAFMVLRKKEN